jgi:hypothetical protein
MAPRLPRSTLETCSSQMKFSTRNFLHQKSKPKIGIVTEEGRLQSIYLLFIRTLVKNTTSRTIIHRPTASVVLPLLLLLLPPLTLSPKAIGSATSLLSALVLLTNYSSGTKPFSEPTLQSSFFPLIMRPPVFVFPQRGTGPAKHALCPSVLSLPQMVLVLQNVNAFKILSARKQLPIL